MTRGVVHPTHTAAGALAAAVALRELHVPPEAWPAALIVGAVAAMLPDIDMPGSFVGRRVPVSAVISGVVKHRTATHSLVASALFAAGLRSFLVWMGLPPYQIWVMLVAGVVGYLSHLAVDLLNPEGAQLLWPFGGKLSLAKVLPWPLTFATGTWPESWILRPVLLTALVATLYDVVSRNIL